MKSSKPPTISEIVEIAVGRSGRFDRRRVGAEELSAVPSKNEAGVRTNKLVPSSNLRIIEGRGFQQPIVAAYPHSTNDVRDCLSATLQRKARLEPFPVIWIISRTWTYLVMLKPSVQVHNLDGLLLGEFWDCLRLDSNAVQDLRSKYEAHTKGGGLPFLVVDLLGVSFAGSASLGHFVALHRIARGKGGRIIFCNVDPNVFEVFRVSKLDPLFSFVTDRAAAIELAMNPSAIAPRVEAPGASLPPSPETGTERKSTGDGLLRSSRRRKLS